MLKKEMIINCSVCGKEFAAVKKQGPIPKYCSFECRCKATKERRRIERETLKEAMNVNSYRLALQKLEEKKKQNKKIRKLSQVAEEAKKAGLSYGMYVHFKEKAKNEK